MNSQAVSQCADIWCEVVCDISDCCGVVVCLVDSHMSHQLADSVKVAPFQKAMPSSRPGTLREFHNGLL